MEYNGKEVKETEYLTDAFSREAVRFVNEAAAKSAGIIDATKESEADGPFRETIKMLSDGDAALASALGLAEDMGKFNIDVVA